MSSKTLEQYLVGAYERGQFDHHLRMAMGPGGKITFYIRPDRGDGETLDFVVRGNGLALNVTQDSDLSQIPKHPSHPDVPRPSDVELVELARGVCHAIEACGASPELTHAVTLASNLMVYLQKPRPEPSCATSLTGEAQGSARSADEHAIALAHAAGKLVVDGSHAVEASVRGACCDLAMKLMKRAHQVIDGTVAPSDQ